MSALRACSQRIRRPRAVILPVVLVMIGLLALTMTGFIFFVRAETAGIQAHADGEQARLACESGFEQVVAVLRANPHSATAWFDQQALFRHALVWAEKYDRASDPVRQSGAREDVFGDTTINGPAWRFSVVAMNLDGPRNTVRFGITPESGKLNLNLATEEQLTRLLAPLLTGLRVENPSDLLDALLDWRDDDDELRGNNSAENEYYNALEPPYVCKNGSFDTIEELLLVRGFNAALLYGEDVNRNGILDLNEDDAEASEPFYDNGDGVLNLGIAPFLTVAAREVDTALDNKARISLRSDATVISFQIAQVFAENADEPVSEEEAETPLSEATIAFILQLKNDDFDFSKLRSPADLYAGGADEAEESDRGDSGLDGGEDGADGEGGEDGVPSGALDPALASSPVTLDELPTLMNRFTVRAAQSAQAPFGGLININTAPQRVLELIPGMTAEAAAAMVAARRELDAKTLRTTAWPLTTGTISAPVFRAIAPAITTKAYQYTVEVVGYADHSKQMRRMEWLIEMIGPLAQIRYHRDLTGLGMAWPLDDERVIVQQP